MDKRNHLAQETSPYLLQHADNPVEWYPWGDAALAKARRENKAILLSIGYAACHWCHVMAHESFSDPATADIMNRLFVNIKVDREERPDLDKIYQSTHYLLTERTGGWPLTTFLTPDDCAPFFSGTYFPLEPRQPLPAFKDVLQKIADIYRHRQSDIKRQNDSLKSVLQKSAVTSTIVPQWHDKPLSVALETIENNYDDRFGGFGDAPKFPQPMILEFLLQSQSPMVLTTLLNMAEGGIYDQLRGGFYRYAVDAQWQIPHFEKMLYDNAQLLPLYARASEVYDEPYFAEVARQTAQWVIDEMQAPNGGYYATLDADSEGHEGKFYVWDISNIEKLLTREEFQMVKIYFGLDKKPNFDGFWHLHIVEALRNVQEKQILASAQQKLLAAREKRVRPHRDEKILTAWNGLMIKGMWVAGKILGEPTLTESANKALTFIKTELWRDGYLHANYTNGKARLAGYLDDYAFLLDAVITVGEDLEFAQALADAMLGHFFDKAAGGFFFTPDDHEELLYRPKPLMDEAIPAGNGVAVRALLALGRLTGDKKYLDAAEKTLICAWPALLKYPAEHCTVLMGYKEYRELKKSK